MSSFHRLCAQCVDQRSKPKLSITIRLACSIWYTYFFDRQLTLFVARQLFCAKYVDRPLDCKYNGCRVLYVCPALN